MAAPLQQEARRPSTNLRFTTSQHHPTAAALPSPLRRPSDGSFPPHSCSHLVVAPSTPHAPRSVTTACVGSPFSCPGQRSPAPRGRERDLFGSVLLISLVVTPDHHGGVQRSSTVLTLHSPGLHRSRTRACTVPHERALHGSLSLGDRSFLYSSLSHTTHTLSCRPFIAVAKGTES